MTPLAALEAEPHIEVLANVGPCPPDPALERVAKALRGARARTGLGEQQLVALLNTQGGAPVSLLMLRRAEHTGVLDLALAVRLADAYGTTTDCLAGRRCSNRQVALPALAS